MLTKRRSRTLDVTEPAELAATARITGCKRVSLRGAPDMLLVLAVAALMLAAALLGPSLLHSRLTALPNPPEPPSSSRTERAAAAPDDRPTARAPEALRIASSLAACGAASSQTTFVPACTWRNDPDHDPRRFLEGMALQQRDIAQPSHASAATPPLPTTD